LFELLGQSPDLAQGREFGSVEIKQVAFRLDGVLFPSPEALDQTVFFIEVQMQNVPVFYQRFFAEIYLYLDLYPQTVDWQAIVIFLIGVLNRKTEICTERISTVTRFIAFIWRTSATLQPSRWALG
jgi:predicted transposase YdaD